MDILNLQAVEVLAHITNIHCSTGGPHPTTGYGKVNQTGYQRQGFRFRWALKILNWEREFRGGIFKTPVNLIVKLSKW